MFSPFFFLILVIASVFYSTEGRNINYIMLSLSSNTSLQPFLGVGHCWHCMNPVMLSKYTFFLQNKFFVSTSRQNTNKIKNDNI